MDVESELKRLLNSWSKLNELKGLRIGNIVQIMRFKSFKRNRYLVYLVILILVVFVVTGIFRLNEDRKIAALEAGTLFCLIPLIIFFYEVTKAKFSQILLIVTLVQFWILFAIPIFYMRLSHWDVDFTQLNILGISAEKMHKFSSWSYMLIVGACVRAWVLESVRMSRSETSGMNTK